MKYKAQKISVACLIIVSIIIVSCNSKIFKSREAIDDQNEYDKAQLIQSSFSNIINAEVETKAVKSPNVNEDAADDPAIWINEKDVTKSIVFGSNKLSGIHSYNLEGKEVQYIACGRINNVDVRQGINIGNELIDILAGSNRSDRSISIFKISDNGNINESIDYNIDLGSFEPYGFCLYKEDINHLYAFVNNKNGHIRQYQLFWNQDKEFSSKLVRSLKLGSQVEGMVVDDENQKLYVGEEQVGIYQFSAKSDAGKNGKVIGGSTKKNNKIRFDIEGLALISPHYLVASVQGSFSYAIFDMVKNEYLTSFIIKGGHVDGVEETDGIEIFNGNLGHQFPNGVLVVQDGFNYDGNQKNNQNFKIVDLNNVLSFIE